MRINKELTAVKLQPGAICKSLFLSRIVPPGHNAISSLYNLSAVIVSQVSIAGAARS